LATSMGGTWASFAATGDPGPASNTHAATGPNNHVPWPRYSNTTDMDLVLDVGSLLRRETHPRATYCNFWAEWRAKYPQPLSGYVA
jgi:hypothetical protein